MVDDGVDDNGHVRQRHAGLCHAGVMNAAKKLAADLAPRLESLVGKGGDCRGFSLRFVGHSLGGSVAALAAFLLRDRFPQVRCIAQSPFPYLDAEAADTLVESGTDVTSFVFGDEFGPRKTQRVSFPGRQSLTSPPHGTTRASHAYPSSRRSRY